MAFVNIAQWASDNLLAVWTAARATDGHFAGIDSIDETDTGSDSGMRRLRGGITFPIPIPQQATARTRGDGKTLANWQRSADQDNQYLLDMAVRDMTADAFFGGGQTFLLGYYRTLGILGAGSSRKRDAVLLLHRAAQSQAADSLNAEGYENLLVFSNKIVPVGDDQFQQDQVGGSRYQGVANPVSVTPWGVTVEELALFSDGITASWVTEFPDMFHAIVGDGADTVIPVDLTPADDNVERVVIVDFTASLAADALNYVTPTTVSVEDKEISVGSPLTSGHIYVVQYQFAPELL